MEGRMAASDLSFDGFDDDDDSDTTFFAPVNYLEQDGGNPEDMVAEEDWQVSATEKLSGALSALDERSRDIIQSRWLSDDKLTLHDLAARYEVSAERIRQIEKNAMKKLQAAVAA